MHKNSRKYNVRKNTNTNTNTNNTALADDDLRGAYATAAGWLTRFGMWNRYGSVEIDRAGIGFRHSEEHGCEVVDVTILRKDGSDWFPLLVNREFRVVNY